MVAAHSQFRSDDEPELLLGALNLTGNYGNSQRDLGCAAWMEAKSCGAYD